MELLVRVKTKLLAKLLAICSILFKKKCFNVPQYILLSLILIGGFLFFRTWLKRENRTKTGVVKPKTLWIVSRSAWSFCDNAPTVCVRVTGACIQLTSAPITLLLSVSYYPPIWRTPQMVRTQIRLLYKFNMNLGHPVVLNCHRCRKSLSTLFQEMDWRQIGANPFLESILILDRLLP